MVSVAGAAEHKAVGVEQVGAAQVEVAASRHVDVPGAKVPAVVLSSHSAPVTTGTALEHLCVAAVHKCLVHDFAHADPDADPDLQPEISNSNIN